MILNTYSTYFLSTGIFTGIAIRCPNEQLAINVPGGCGCVIGEYDALSQKIDLESGEVVDYRPAQPSENHEWDAASRRWAYVPTLDDRKASKLQQINDRCAELLAGVRNGYPPDEVESWPKQEAEARAYAASTDTPTPLLSALSLSRGVALDDLVNRVIRKADLFAAASGKIIGTRQGLQDEIAAAETIQDVEAITWPEE